MVRLFGLSKSSFAGMTVRDYFFSLPTRSPNRNRFQLLRRGFVCPNNTRIYFTCEGEVVASVIAEPSTQGQGYIPIKPGSIEVHNNIWLSELIDAGVRVLPKNDPRRIRALIPADARARVIIEPQDEEKIELLLHGQYTLLANSVPSPTAAKIATMDAADPMKASSKTNKYLTKSEQKNWALARSSYTCEIDPAHLSFPVNYSGHSVNYMEAHHLIPMSQQFRFDRANPLYDTTRNIHANLDQSNNLISLCPICHKAIHHSVAAYRNAIIATLFNNRQTALNAIIPGITLQELISYY